MVVKGLSNPLITNIVNGELISVIINETNYAHKAEVKLPDGKTLSINTRFVVYAAGTNILAILIQRPLYDSASPKINAKK